jgi:hypothetical protein
MSGELILASVSVVFAAFVVWLTVRIVNRRERWAKWTLVAALAGLPVLYVASFGPACWISSRTDSQTLPVTYLPIGWIMENSPQPIAMALVDYAHAGMLPGSLISVPVSDGLPRLILR